MSGKKECTARSHRTAIGNQACGQGPKVLYSNATRLFAQPRMAKVNGSSIKELMIIEKKDLSTLDDFGIQPFDQGSRASPLEIIEDRHGKRSVTTISQLPVKQWYDVVGKKTVADPLMDRIVHNAQRVDLKGESQRRKWTKKQTEPSTETAKFNPAVNNAACHFSA